jgi:hypothetical protein
MNPLKGMYMTILRNYKWCLIKGLIVGLLVFFIALLLYAMPGYTVKAIFGV